MDTFTAVTDICRKSSSLIPIGTCQDPSGTPVRLALSFSFPISFHSFLCCLCAGVYVRPASCQPLVAFTCRCAEEEQQRGDERWREKKEWNRTDSSLASPCFQDRKEEDKIREGKRTARGRRCDGLEIDYVETTRGDAAQRRDTPYRDEQ